MVDSMGLTEELFVMKGNFLEVWRKLKEDTGTVNAPENRNIEKL